MSGWFGPTEATLASILVGHHADLEAAYVTNFRSVIQPAMLDVVARCPVPLTGCSAGRSVPFSRRSGSARRVNTTNLLRRGSDAAVEFDIRVLRGKTEGAGWMR